MGGSSTQENRKGPDIARLRTRQGDINRQLHYTYKDYCQNSKKGKSAGFSSDTLTVRQTEKNILKT